MISKSNISEKRVSKNSIHYCEFVRERRKQERRRRLTAVSAVVTVIGLILWSSYKKNKEDGKKSGKKI